MNKMLVLLALCASASMAAPAPDTSLVLKPDAARLKAAHDVGNRKCPVSGEAIGGDMGPGRTVVYKGKAVHLCCGSCVKTFAKDPAKYLALAEKK